MFEKIIDFSVRNKLLIALFTIGLVAGGFYALDHIPIDAVPDITNNQVQVVTRSPSLTAEEVERFITHPIEVSMANLPGVVELRSISRYGLSVITIVFDDDMRVTDTRQYVSEQINIAAEQIPPGLGQPELMPITTGLGEVYQYVLELEEGYEDQFDAMALRTLQDWIVKRQLSGIPGIVEVSSFGGFVRQIEVAADPARLRSFGLTLHDLLSAIEKNNQNTGGSYLDRGANAVYIRAEGVVKSLDDIGNIVVKQSGVPVLLKQVAAVQEGYPPRYGAMTRNGEGEAVGGITLMLKDANSSRTLDYVHERVKAVQASLPEGVRIVPYLDRSELVARTTRTIKTNLIEGGIIVIVVLVLLLGDLRAGLIVASVIPLSLMFAFIMMHVFGVSANLMSLGALDFGIVVDGAVIIVEGVLHALVLHHVGKRLSQSEMDAVVVRSAGSIYKSAAFGVLIIIVVFIPIMTLTGIEGKMFRPMAQTVSFAVLGALILSLTYVPMLAALILKKKVEDKDSISRRIIQAIQKAYRPTLQRALMHPRVTLAIAGGLFIVSLVVFFRLGGVFIPQLEEGDLAMQVTLPAGSSLDETIRTTTQAETILLENFPEVRQVVSKIGTAEVPTDPMSVELADVMIVLKEKDEWTSTDNRETLVAMMEDKLSAIVGASFDFTQPIQLRFNELITGSKTDVAVQIYGEDLEVLHEAAVEVAARVSGVSGAADVVVEQTEGLPQLLIQYNRQRIAQHGVSIDEVNTVIRAAFAGESAGVVFEGEKKFDLVVRLNALDRQTFNLDRLYVSDHRGALVPVSELVTITETVGPAQISRDNTRRRITVGINVRGRDIESVVRDVQTALADFDLPPGYNITYGGDFENLQRAKDRLIIAVPVSLALIMLFLFLAFGKMRYALLIFVAVPLSAIGGIFALWLRGLPFSISAGVGFIALFGVAVLNGIVLISYFNELKAEGKLSLDDLVVQGGLVRLRPVIMTASVAALGFLPMALSNTAGAEVQRPLATVVIGGLISATLLTLFVLPVLYRSIEQYAARSSGRRISPVAMVLFLSLLGMTANAQSTLVISEEDAVKRAMENHPQVEIARLGIEAERSQRKASFNLPSTDITVQYGQMNSAARDPYLEVGQRLGSLPSHFRRAELHRERVALSTERLGLTQREISLRVKQAWQEWVYRREVVRELTRQLALYEDFEARADVQYRVGERSLLEKTLIENSLYELRNQHSLESENLEQAHADLQLLLMTDETLLPARDTLEPRSHAPISVEGVHPTIRVQEGEVSVRNAEAKLERSLFFPELRVGYFRQNITETDIRFQGLYGFTFEIAIPLWVGPQLASAQRARIAGLQANAELAWIDRQLATARLRADSNVEKYRRLLGYYEQEGLEQADIIRRTATMQMEAGEIDFFQYIQSMQRYSQTRLQFLETVREYNLAVIESQFYTNNEF